MVWYGFDSTLGPCPVCISWRGLVDDVEHALDALDQGGPVALVEVGAAETAAGEHEVTGEEDAGVLAVQTEVVVLVPWRVNRDVFVWSPICTDSPSPRTWVTPLRVAVEGHDIDVEGVEDGLEVGDVVVVGVGQDDDVEVVHVGFDCFDDVELVANVDERGPLASHEEDVAREDVTVQREVCDHRPTLVVPGFWLLPFAGRQIVRRGYPQGYV